MQVKEKHSLWESVTKETGDFSGLKFHHETSDKAKNQLFIYRMLRLPLRKYVIKKIKAPLQKVIILVGNRLPEITKGNTVFKNTHSRIDIRDKFFKFFGNKGKKEMFRCGWNLYLAECEHDRDYRYLDEWYLEERIKMVLSGEWQPRLEGWPHPSHWRETQPYGGEHSIIYKLQAHREEILKLIGEQ